MPNLDTPVAEIPPIPPNDPQPLPRRRLRRWPWILLLVLNVLIIGSAAAILLDAQAWAKQGAGSEFLILIFAPLFIAVPVIGAVDFVALAVYLVRRRPSGLKLVVISLIELILLGIAVDTAANYYRTNHVPVADAISLISSCQAGYVYPPGYSKSQPKVEIWTVDSAGRTQGEQLAEPSKWPAIKAAVIAARDKCPHMFSPNLAHDPADPNNEGPFPANPTPVYITQPEAVDLLQNCKLIGFYYTPGDNADRPTSGTNTGIVLDYKERPLHIHISDNLISTLVPVARAAQSKCPNLQFWHDGRYEQRDAQGNWK